MAQFSSVTFADAQNQRQLAGVIAQPEGSGPFPAVIVIHEWWGLNEGMRRMAGNFADAGFLALAVDLFHGPVTDDPTVASGLMENLKTPVAMEDLAGAVAFLKAHPACTGMVGVSGFCLGGGLTLAAACNVAGLSAAVPFYGLPRPEYADWSKAKCPIQGHYALRDGFITPERVQAAWALQNAAGLQTERFDYDADHAFMRASDPAVYSPENAAIAWKRAVNFLHQHLK